MEEDLSQICTIDGCNNRRRANDKICTEHGSTVRMCKQTGCESWAARGGYCMKHGGESYKRMCTVDGCKSKEWIQGKCYKHRDKTHPFVIRHTALKKRRATMHCNSRNCRKNQRFKGYCGKHARALGYVCKYKDENGRSCSRTAVEQGGMCVKCNKL